VSGLEGAHAVLVLLVVVELAERDEVAAVAARAARLRVRGVDLPAQAPELAARQGMARTIGARSPKFSRSRLRARAGLERRSSVRFTSTP